jgi:putative FmdB family regulatory protein
MPRYEYRCRTCDDTFEVRRSMSESDAPAACPQGHADTTKLLSVFASVGASGSASSGPAPSASPTGGGCGGHCACH